MADFIFKYSAGVYQRKISALDGYYSRLGSHLEQLETYQNQMKEFYEGDEASQDLYKAIGNTIDKVKKAMEDCQNVNMEYQKVVDKQLNVSGTVDTIAADLEAASKKSVEVAGEAAKVLSLLG